MADVGLLDSADGAILPAELVRSDRGFVVTARYLSSMDQLVFLESDAPYRADRVDVFLTLLWHPHEDRIIGVKIKGFGFLYNTLKKICGDFNDESFVPFVKLLELALVGSWPQISTHFAAAQCMSQRLRP